MPSKLFLLDGDMPVTIYKRKSNRSLRLSITSAGVVRVSIPAWAPYSAGLSFAKSRRSWIVAQHRAPQLLSQGQAIGKAHHLHFKSSDKAFKVSSRISGGEVVISHPVEFNSSHPEVQQVAERAGIRALRSQAEQLLPQRLTGLADRHDFTFKGVSVKHLKSRWGSCDNQQNIVLNLFLMQLPWEYIDYVLLHELTHTRILRHGPEFWQAMEKLLPNVTQVRKELHAYRPALLLQTPNVT